MLFIINVYINISTIFTHKYVLDLHFVAAEELGYQFEKPVRRIKFVTYRKNGMIIDDSQIFPDMHILAPLSVHVSEAPSRSHIPDNKKP